jgi:hypothetical protein
MNNKEQFRVNGRFAVGGLLMAAGGALLKEAIDIIKEMNKNE